MNRQIVDAEGNKTFNAKVHIRDAKGRITQVNAYTRYSIGECEYFRDKKTGICFYADGTQIAESDLPEFLKPTKAAVSQKQEAPAPIQATVKAKPLNVKVGAVAQKKPAAPAKEESEASPEPVLEDKEHPSATDGL